VDAALHILAQVYPHADHLELEIKLLSMVKSVQVDHHLERSGTVRVKLDNLFQIGSNRRALGTSSPFPIRLNDDSHFYGG
jgi:hypothetical protein